MAEQVLSQSGLYFDDFHRLRIVQPTVAQLNEDLKTESKRFLESMGQFEKLVEALTSIAESLGKQKLQAISSRNALRCIAKQKEVDSTYLKIIMHERLTELERLHREAQKLRQLEEEQKEYLQKFM